MTNKDDIVIPRSELPNTTLKFSVNSIDTSVNVEGSTVRVAFCEASSKNARRTALAYLAASEAINQLLAEQAKAEDEAKLREESNFLRDKLKHLYGSPDTWEQIAKAARELHGK